MIVRFCRCVEDIVSFVPCRLENNCLCQIHKQNYILHQQIGTAHLFQSKSLKTTDLNAVFCIPLYFLSPQVLLLKGKITFGTCFTQKHTNNEFWLYIFRLVTLHVYCIVVTLVTPPVVTTRRGGGISSMLSATKWRGLCIYDTM